MSAALSDVSVTQELPHRGIEDDLPRGYQLFLQFLQEYVDLCQSSGGVSFRVKRGYTPNSSWAQRLSLNIASMYLWSGEPPERVSLQHDEFTLGTSFETWRWESMATYNKYNPQQECCVNFLVFQESSPTTSVRISCRGQNSINLRNSIVSGDKSEAKKFVIGYSLKFNAKDDSHTRSSLGPKANKARFLLTRLMLT